MKIKFTFLFIFAFFTFQAQNIIIQDAALKSLLINSNTLGNAIAVNSNGSYISIDVNGDGEIQLSEASAVYRLVLPLNTINNLSGLNEFPLLKELEVQNLNLPSSSLLISDFPSLEKLKINSGTVSSLTIQNSNTLNNISVISYSNDIHFQNLSVQNIDISSVNNSVVTFNLCNQLKKIKISNTNIQSLDLSNLVLLEDVEISSNALLTNINFSGDNALKKLRLTGNSLSSILLPNPSIVNFLNLSDNNFTTFNVQPFTTLSNFDISLNQLTNIDLSLNTNLQIVNLSNNLLNSVNFNNNNNIISHLYIDDNKLQNINLSSLLLLKSYTGQHNLFTIQDFTQNTQLQFFNCSFNPNLKIILMKNGSSSGTSLSYAFSDTPQLNYICANNIDTYMINNFLYSYNQPNVVVNSYCNFTPGGIYYVIKGETRFDSNTNGCDVNDVRVPQQKFNVFNSNSGNVPMTSNGLGSYNFPVMSGNTIITPILENPTYFNINPTSFTANFPTQASPLTQNFCLTANGNHNDLEILVIPITNAAPGFNAKYKIVYKNKGTTAQSGNLTFSFNDSLSDFLTSSISPTSQGIGTLNWNFTGLQPFETKEIIVTLQLNTPTQTPPVQGGDVLHFTSQINGLTDETPLDNNFSLNQTVVNSFDPNDKTCLQGTNISQNQVGNYVHYLIRFENTGTANAQNIVVKDEIDINKFDLNSLIALSGSHSFVTRITGTNAVEFIFENIQLPFDDANNDGYVSFKIKTKSNLVAGNTFSNKANIYFDYNAPIITNNYTTTVENMLATQEITKQSFGIYPNPVKDILYFNTKENVLKAQVFDAAGRIVASYAVEKNSINLSNLPKGNYMIKIFTKDSTETKKIIKE